MERCYGEKMWKRREKMENTDGNRKWNIFLKFLYICILIHLKWVPTSLYDPSGNALE